MLPQAQNSLRGIPPKFPPQKIQKGEFPPKQNPKRGISPPKNLKKGKSSQKGIIVDFLSDSQKNMLLSRNICLFFNFCFVDGAWVRNEGCENI